MPRAARLGASLALVPLLSGCVAMAALPVLAGGAMVAGGNARIRAATPRPQNPDKSASLARTKELTTGAGITLTNLTALPPPDPPGAGASTDPWRAFFDFALDRANAAKGDKARSALLEPGTSLALPRQLACRAETPAVLIDLDPDTRPFIPEAAASPPAALVEGLTRLREAGVAVVWISALPASYVTGVGDALRGSGLDAEGRDPLLLARGPDDRKQVLREEANRDVCVIAVAGDRKADFDELFEYLRDPASAAGLDSLIGAGWFLVPPPLG
ncbi:MAG TPA: hypothetical protein VM055_03680 [Novosphingobium sp.]|nr:hypothetical protein [Novosphingobium sp.]